MSLGEFVAWLAICGGVTVLVGARWADALLADEARYVRAVRGLPASPVARRATPIVVAALARRHGVPPRWSSGVGRSAGRLSSGRVAGIAWVAAHRRLHRAARSDWRLTLAMLALAAAGQVLAPRTT